MIPDRDNRVAQCRNHSDEPACFDAVGRLVVDEQGENVSQERVFGPDSFFPWVCTACGPEEGTITECHENGSVPDWLAFGGRARAAIDQSNSGEVPDITEGLGDESESVAALREIELNCGRQFLLWQRLTRRKDAHLVASALEWLKTLRSPPWEHSDQSWRG